jgi:phenylacetate-coenzyme A ligase PaaK-like adenylate-forming protein
MPLIRHNMNDLASAGPSPCRCGRNTQPLSLIGGRGGDILVTPRGYGVLGNMTIAAKIDPQPPIEKLQFYQG